MRVRMYVWSVPSTRSEWNSCDLLRVVNIMQYPQEEESVKEKIIGRGDW